MPEWLLSFLVNGMILLGGLASWLILFFLVIVLCVEIWDFFFEKDPEPDPDDYISMGND